MNLIERANLLAKAGRDAKAQRALWVLCQGDPVYWFETFCYTFNPRVDNPDLPFNLYPFQKACIEEWLACIERGEDFGVEKSRDMGVTWMIMLLFQWGWLFRPGWNFLVGSRKQEAVDKPGDLSALFPKLAYNFQFLPRWMQPAGYDARIHQTFMKVINPANGNTITGESSNPDFGRGGRYKAVLLDEFAFWESDEAVWASVSQSTPCRIVVSTPHGKNNKFSRLMLNPENERVDLAALAKR